MCISIGLLYSTVMMSQNTTWEYFTKLETDVFLSFIMAWLLAYSTLYTISVAVIDLCFSVINVPLDRSSRNVITTRKRTLVVFGILFRCKY